jgi:cobalt-zinc-cadmium efflux system outer membrane protein
LAALVHDEAPSSPDVFTYRREQIPALHADKPTGLLAACAAAMALLSATAWGQEPLPPASPAPLSLEEARSLALAKSPAVSAARLRRSVDQAGIAVAREIPNPEARFERQKETPLQALSLAQLIELPGKRSLRVAVAESAARTGDAELARAMAEVRSDVTRAFLAVAATQRRAAVAGELRGLAARARDAASHRLEVGDVSRLDVLQAELAFHQAENESTALIGELAAQRGELNVLIGREPREPTVVADALDEAPPPAPEIATLASNTAVAVVEGQIAEAEARAALARAQRWPDPTVEGAVTHRAEPDFVWGWRAAVGIALPLFTHHAAAVRLEEAAAAQLRSERDALALRVKGAVFAAATRVSSTREQYLRYRDEILPRTREVESMAEDSYREGQTGLPVLLQSLQAARELRGRALQAAADYQAALADLEQAATLGPAK